MTVTGKQSACCSGPLNATAMPGHIKLHHAQPAELRPLRVWRASSHTSECDSEER
jgi:hypothetical protein